MDQQNSGKKCFSLVVRKLTALKLGILQILEYNTTKFIVSLPMFDLPQEDETSQILAEMAAEGIDLSQPMQIDFFAAFEFKEQAEKALPQVQKLQVNQLSFTKVKVQKPEVGGGVELVASVNLIPNAETLDKWDQAFTDCVEKLKGYSDGWGIAL
ncbi:hypothetical protein DS2_03060 [Catenovulum agarivorans DS-2]|uniref:Regulator of ribonuclease activity B domain-containing protein n=1 Tax=Catenovulum agarivorans DS-2 TaxID=1328313 RepID=W7QFS3_9ALTE|nr:ribonuclease E inhibitor RraB [Catenovulum agarivorans]EWH11769.1 hypothetical protein DS2_03060 [Catenovulum agarivorans DS-2]